MMGTVLTGRVWKFGDNISTDYMAPSFGMEDPWEIRKKHILHIHETFPEGCRPGDVIVAGKNFGCGSSRETAPLNLKRLGIGCVVAESFGRIFFRNCMAIAFPVTVCKGVSQLFEEGDRLELDFENSLVKNLTTGKKLKGSDLPAELLEIVREGGILAFLKREYQADPFP
ncbi:MAG: 3-isopropylmalate dehydratase [Desulfobacterales bacterium]|nr:3-isopropylmalate dehydratase [Desulfobacterales bacterium]